MSTTTYAERDRLDFGKHAFKPLKQVPNGYLAWLLKPVAITPRFRSEIQEELDRREDDSPGTGLGLVELLRRVHRELTMKHHPDRGGSLDVMTGINLTIDRIKELCGDRRARLRRAQTALGPPAGGENRIFFRLQPSQWAGIGANFFSKGANHARR